MAKEARPLKASRKEDKKSTFEQGELAIKVELRGPDQATVDVARRTLLRHPEILKQLKGARFRLLSFDSLDPDPKVKSSRVLPPPNRYRAAIYDYTNNRTLAAEGRLDKPRVIEVSEFGTQPLPNHEEFEAAVRILSKHREIGTAIRKGRLRPYPPMPSLIPAELPDGRIERTLGVGLLPSGTGVGHEIVGVNMVRQTVTRFESRAPDGAAAHNPI